jgi:hypothetical protein
LVATVSVRYDFGGADTAPGTQQDVDNLGPPRVKFKLADNATIDENDKLIIPGAGLGPYYSYWKHIYLYCDNADGHTLSNVKLYSEGTNNLGTGVDWKVGLQFPTKNSGSNAGYEVATGASPSGDELVANHGGITTSASIFGYTAASPLSVSISEAGGLINAAGETSNYTLHQINVSNTASAGTTGSITLYFSYDEA